MKRATTKVAKEIGDIVERWDGYAESLQGRAKDIVVPRDTLVRWLMLLRPPRTRKAQAVRSARRTTTKELDALCREVVFLRDGGKCRKCGRSDGLMDWAHVYSRRIKVTRWAPTNSMVLCRTHHLWWHHCPTEAMEWWKKDVGEEAARRLDLLKRSAKPGHPELVRLSLEQERARLQ